MILLVYTLRTHTHTHVLKRLRIFCREDILTNGSFADGHLADRTCCRKAVNNGLFADEHFDRRHFNDSRISSISVSHRESSPQTIVKWPTWELRTTLNKKIAHIATAQETSLLTINCTYLSQSGCSNFAMYIIIRQ